MATGNPLYRRFVDFWLSVFAVMPVGRNRVSPRFDLFACCRVALGTMFSSFWLLANNRWMQLPVGHHIVYNWLAASARSSTPAGCQ